MASPGKDHDAAAPVFGEPAGALQGAIGVVVAGNDHALEGQRLAGNGREATQASGCVGPFDVGGRHEQGAGHFGAQGNGQARGDQAAQAMGNDQHRAARPVDFARQRGHPLRGLRIFPVVLFDAHGMRQHAGPARLPVFGSGVFPSGDDDRLESHGGHDAALG
ncbi:hypothetical protein D3C73_928430 [compost metagenome]